MTMQQAATAGPTKAEMAAMAAEIERERLAKEPFKTMVAPDYPSTIDELRDWAPPPHACVVLEMKGRNVVARGRFVPATRLLVLNVEHRPEQKEKVSYYVQKGAKVLGYYNFPTFEDPSTERAAKVRMHSSGKGKHPWKNLAAFLNQQMRKDQANAQLVKDRDDAVKRVAELEAENAKFKARESKKPQGGNGGELHP